MEEKEGIIPVEFAQKERYNTDDLREIMRILRSDEGCPWDREQDHRSLRSDFLEETCEAIDAIDSGDPAALCEELGDVLLQVIFHAQIAEESGEFSYDDITDGICRKLVQRHPHVFGQAKAETAQEVLAAWDGIKRKSRGDIPQSALVAHLPKSLPALMRTQKAQERAARIGFDWPDVSGALESLESEVRELRREIEAGSAERASEELGDVLFSAVNVSRHLAAQSEFVLQASLEKFIRRVQAAQEFAEQNGETLESCSPNRLDEIWQQVKSGESPASADDIKRG